MSGLQSSGGDSRSGRPKLPIPRWGKPGGHDTHCHGGVEKRRVLHACEPCREKKTKCDGDRPSCHHCRLSEVDCFYGDGKRERAKKNLRALENRVAALEEFVQEIQPYLDSTGQLAVQKLLVQSASSSHADSARNTPMSIDGANTNDFFRPENYAGESLVSAEVGSTGSTDHITEDRDTNSVTKPSGYLGKTSETAWMDRVSEELERVDHEARPNASFSREAVGTTSGAIRRVLSRQRTQDSCIEDLELSIPGRQVDMFGLPFKLAADKLVDLYFTTVHPLFPIIQKPHFMRQYNAYYSSLETPSLESSKKWLTVLNLVFAISETCLKSGLTEGEDERRDVDYFIRSRVLGALDGGSVFEIPDLGKVQALGLTGLYLLASVQINRAWNVTGLAIRLAHGIGLHLRNDSRLDENQKNLGLRVWYCLCCLETNLCSITGRPCAIKDRSCSAPCPSGLGDEILPREYQGDSTLDTYFLKHRSLNIISAEVLDSLYSAQSPWGRNWSQLQDSIRELSSKLEQWRITLPVGLDFLKEESDRVFRRQRLDLALQYHTIQMLINRPCLCLMDGRIPNQSSDSREFDKVSAATCVGSARAIIHLIVDEPNRNKLIHHSPWWCLLHYLMPAKAIIMLEMVYQAVHTPENTAALFMEGKIVLEWLRSVSGVNTALKKHSLNLSNQLRRVAPRIGEHFEDTNIDNLPPPIPPSSPSHFRFHASPQPPHDRVDLSPHDLEKSRGNLQEHDFDLASPLVWWSSTQSHRDQIMADAPILYSDLQDRNQQIDINPWLDGEGHEQC